MDLIYPVEMEGMELSLWIGGIVIFEICELILSDYMKIWFNIQVIIYRLLLNISDLKETTSSNILVCFYDTDNIKVLIN